jgi:hypothetical protein
MYGGSTVEWGWGGALGGKLLVKRSEFSPFFLTSEGASHREKRPCAMLLLQSLENEMLWALSPSAPLCRDGSLPPATLATPSWESEAWWV